MCLNPLLIRNPHYTSSAYRSEMGQFKKADPRTYSHKEYIDVPCGKCPECRQSYYNGLLQRALVEARSSYLYFVTLTYDNQHIPHVKLGDKIVYYSDYYHIQQLIKRLRNNNVLDRDFRYICVNEYGDTFNRPHFHLIFFVAKRKSDDVTTPFHIERTLFDNLHKYYSINVGTRKKPIYEPLFTYKARYTSQGLKSNYFVKYVNPSGSDVFYDIKESNVYVLTIQYLLSYINKSSKFEKSLLDYIDKFKFSDPILYRKYRSLLRCSVHYSKGFGFGFIDGEKHFMTPLSSSLSLAVQLHSEFKRDLPSQWDDFCKSYPHLSERVLTYLYTNSMADYEDLEEYKDSMSADDFIYFSISSIYFPKTLDNLIKFHFYDTHVSIPTVSYFVNFVAYKAPYKLSYVYTSDNNLSSPVYNYIRQHIESGLLNKVPFIPFLVNSSKPYYIPLCNFYRRYCSVEQDMLNIFNVLNIKDFDEWRDIFVSYQQSRLNKGRIEKANEFRHYISENLICNSQKHCLALSSDGRNTLQKLFKIII